MTQVQLADTFQRSAARLTTNEKGRLLDLAGKLREDASLPGLSLERVARAPDPNVWAVRVSQHLRAILWRDGALALLLYAGHHDDAYRWTERHRMDTDRRSGALQLVQLDTVREVSGALGAPSLPPLLPPSRPPGGAPDGGTAPPAPGASGAVGEAPLRHEPAGEPGPRVVGEPIQRRVAPLPDGQPQAEERVDVVVLQAQVPQALHQRPVGLGDGGVEADAVGHVHPFPLRTATTGWRRVKRVHQGYATTGVAWR
jgi:hypothetical protein